MTLGLPAASVRDLSKSYDSIAALREISFDVPTGEAVGLLGPNGAGKSTTLGPLLGFLAPTSGTAELFGQCPDVPEVRRRVGYVPEHVVLPSHHCPASLLALHAGLLDVPPGQRARRVEDVLARAGLTAAAKRRVPTPCPETTALAWPGRSFAGVCPGHVMWPWLASATRRPLGLSSLAPDSSWPRCRWSGRAPSRFRLGR